MLRKMFESKRSDNNHAAHYRSACQVEATRTDRAAYQRSYIIVPRKTEGHSIDIKDNKLINRSFRFLFVKMVINNRKILVYI